MKSNFSFCEMQKKHTALDWLQGMIYFECNIMPNKTEIKISFERLESLFEQAKLMEKEQIMKANSDGFLEAFGQTPNQETIAPKQYYEQTYGKTAND